MLALPLCALLAAAAPPTIRITATVDGAPAQGSLIYARAGQRVELRAELRPDVPDAAFDWFQLEPVATAVDNTTPQFHFEPIGYQAVELPACKGSRTCAPSGETLRFTNLTRVAGTGVVALQARARLPDGRIVETPGAGTATAFGLPREVPKVAFRRDDTYLGYLTELFNTPYIFGSSSEGKRHQTDELIGSDCADLTVYGARRMGLKVDYTNTWGMEKVAPLVGVMTSASAPLSIGDGPKQVHVGDVIYFPGSRHVAALYEDREPMGVLDENDLMLHTCWAPATLQRIGDAAPNCFSYPIKVLRFPFPPPPRR
ncbi:MAG TPA: hypothetical protein VIG99_23240 [Myxococcaceae bacterium]|jgi:hypothetical protein